MEILLIILIASVLWPRETGNFISGLASAIVWGILIIFAVGLVATVLS